MCFLFSCYALPGATERHFFMAHTNAKTIVRENELRRLCGFVVLTCFIARPTTRAEVVSSLLTVKCLNTKLVGGKALSLSFNNHKTANSYGALVLRFSDVLSAILLIYLRRIRPLMIKKPELWGKFSKQMVSVLSLSLSTVPFYLYRVYIMYMSLSLELPYHRNLCNHF